MAGLPCPVSVSSLPFPRLAFALPLPLPLVPMYPRTYTLPPIRTYPILTRFVLDFLTRILGLDSLNWDAILFGFASGADLSLAGSGQWAAGVRVMDPGRLLGCTDSAPGQPQVPTDAFRCPHRLERHKRPKGMPGTHSKNDSDHTGSQPRSSVIVHRSSSVRSFGAHPPDGVVLFQVIYRLSGILRSYAPYALTLPTAPGVYLPTHRTPVCR